LVLSLPILSETPLGIRREERREFFSYVLIGVKMLMFIYWDVKIMLSEGTIKAVHEDSEKVL
jgi:hypothetical protein